MKRYLPNEIANAPDGWYIGHSKPDEFSVVHPICYYSNPVFVIKSGDVVCNAYTLEDVDSKMYCYDGPIQRVVVANDQGIETILGESDD